MNHEGKWKPYFSRLCIAGAALIFLVSVHKGSSAATMNTVDPFAGMMPMSKAELMGRRGGFSVSTPLGVMQFDIAVTINTQVNTPVGTFGLTTNLVFNDAGQITSAQNRTTGTPPPSTSISVSSGGGPIVSNTAAQPQPTTAANSPPAITPAITTPLTAAATPPPTAPNSPPAITPAITTPSTAAATPPPTVPVSNGSVRTTVTSPGLEIVHDVGANHATASAAASLSRITGSQSFVIDMVFNNLTHLTTLAKNRALVSRALNSIGRFTAR